MGDAELRRGRSALSSTLFAHRRSGTRKLWQAGARGGGARQTPLDGAGAPLNAPRDPQPGPPRRAREQAVRSCCPRGNQGVRPTTPNLSAWACRGPPASQGWAPGHAPLPPPWKGTHIYVCSEACASCTRSDAAFPLPSLGDSFIPPTPQRGK